MQHINTKQRIHFFLFTLRTVKPERNGLIMFHSHLALCCILLSTRIAGLNPFIHPSIHSPHEYMHCQKIHQELKTKATVIFTLMFHLQFPSCCNQPRILKHQQNLFLDSTKIYYYQRIKLLFPRFRVYYNEIIYCAVLATIN